MVMTESMFKVYQDSMIPKGAKDPSVRLYQSNGELNCKKTKNEIETLDPLKGILVFDVHRRVPGLG